MLLTMEEAYKVEHVAMPNPERLDKVGSNLSTWCFLFLLYLYFLFPQISPPVVYMLRLKS